MNYPTATDMIDVDVKLYSGDYLGVFLKSDWNTLYTQVYPIPGLTEDLKVKPIFTYLKYLRSIHLPEGLSTTTSVSKTIGQSDTVSIDATVSESIKAGIGVIEDTTEFSLSVGYSHTWESSRTTEDSYTLQGPASIYFYQPVTVIAYLQEGPLPIPILGSYPTWATKLTPGVSVYFLSAISHDKTIALNNSVGLTSFKSICEDLFNDGFGNWK